MKANKQVQREAKQLFRLCLVNGKLQEDRTREVAMRILRSKHRGYLRLLKSFHRLVKIDYARHTAHVQSAVPLPFDLAHKLEARLTILHGPHLDVRFAHDPILIGGIRIKLGSDLYDATLQSRLSALERCF